MPARPSIYWAGSYPHNKIAAGINTLLRRRGAPFKIAFERPLIDHRSQGLAGAIGFNYEVQAELSDAARQLQHHGLRLYVHHDIGELNGNLDLSLDELSPDAGSMNVQVHGEPGQPDLHPIWVNGLADRLQRLQRQALSARFDLSYDHADDYLAGTASDLFEAFALAPKHPAPCPVVATRSWFSILAPASAAALEIWVPDPASQRSETVRLTPPDRHLLTATLPDALRVAQQTTRMALATLDMRATNGRCLHFALPTRQWAELCDAMQVTA
jgi:hypothetical protein